ncbi:hypothetical protein LRP30_36875 [Bradyrhizobium sp. C-145]|uniref:hypothetical protein n=1 Tax=Bradyrhizobium sp. C-145 TaxID=574727 RepID=UPI00201B5FE6|nr:hypothetical protein [Bradyrhizobium sp. C-145]UQR62291.1 hypothetical protein LRP30_36875 [Bradyrhizobium sp. C-145]
MSIQIVGATVGRQFIEGQPDRFTWRVSYERDGRGLFHYEVDGRRAQSSMDAVEIARRELGAD